MSTYNGEKYLKEQIDSILAQEDVKVSLFIRDDGSSDSTVEIINKYINNGAPVKLYIGNNLGACNSFFDLLWHTDLDYDYYAFSDQDDVWLDDKLIRGICILDDIDDVIKLYSSKVTVVDEHLCPVTDITGSVIEPDFGNSLIENVVSGCTIIMNGEFVKKARSYRKPQYQQMHDWWAYKFGSLFGRVVVDKESRILYRQHNDNTIGLADSFKTRMKIAFSKQKELKTNVIKQNMEFLELYDLPNDKKKLIEQTIFRKNKIQLLFNKKIYRRTWYETIIYKLWMMLW